MSNWLHCLQSSIFGPEFVTESTRIKAGTAQKLVLNMISVTNNKLIDRGTICLRGIRD